MATVVTMSSNPILLAGPPAAEPAESAGGRLVEIVVPVYNEEHVLEASIRRLHTYLKQSFPYRFRVTVADNASTDGTWKVACRLADEFPEVRGVHLDLKGRGRALRKVWSESDADVVSYMDVDLSTGLDAFLPLVAPLLSGHSDLAIGSRLHRGSAVVRGPKREFISRTYNFLLRTTMAAKFTDAQCGFKAARAEVVKPLLTAVEDEAWFFDTELLLLAERTGLRIHEVPVDWVDDPDSRVDIVRTVLDDLRGMARVAGRVLSGTGGPSVPVPPRGPAASATGASTTRLRRQLSGFIAVGILSTLAYLVLYLLLRQITPAWLANAVSLFLCAIANTAANRRFTFGITGTKDALRHQLEGLIAFLIGLVVSEAALGIVHSTVRDSGHLVDLATLVGANALSTVVRFVLMRVWIFHPRRGTHRAGTGSQQPAEVS
jgi:putative flippase GtrA